MVDTLALFKKGSLIASLFAFAVSVSSSFASEMTGADLIDVASTHTWSALLHEESGKVFVTDQQFIRSLPNYSPIRELRLTLQLFQETPESICRFPARYIFLSSTSLKNLLPPMPSCPEYEEFLRQAPMDELSVIYASENLVNPSSMMGHAMLAIEGVRDDGFNAKHSVSYFTELDSFNPLIVLWETLIQGKPGFFLVKPLSRHYEFYNLAEQRNVWRYALNLTHWQKRLIQAHFWELKHTQLDYFFHANNCATVLARVLRLVSAEVSGAGWLTPIDLAKQAHEAGLVAYTELMPAEKWRIRLLQQELDERQRGEIYVWFEDGASLTPDDSTGGILQATLAESSMRYLQQTGTASDALLRDLNSRLHRPYDEAPVINIDQQRSPLNTPADSQWSMGFMKYQDKPWYTMRWLVAGHGVEDDNSHYFAENELKLLDLTLRARANQPTLNLHQLALYSARSLTPYDRITGGISGEFRIGWYPHWSDARGYEGAWNVHGGVGATLAVHDDIRVYALAGAGWSRNSYLDQLYVQPEFGAYLYEVFNMKSWLRYQPRWYQSERRQDIWRFNHSVFFDNTALMLEASRLTSGANRQLEWQLNWRHYF